MFQVRIHGRGGQGVVTAAELLSVAVFTEGRHAQAVPSFGSERTGAPVVSFCRISDRPIRTREPITQPDALIVQDPTLTHQVDVFAGLQPEGYVLINSTEAPHDLVTGNALDQLPPGHVRSLDATGLALRYIGRPVPNVVLLGAFAALTGQVSLSAISATVAERFSGELAAGNIAAASEAFAVTAGPREALGAATA